MTSNKIEAHVIENGASDFAVDIAVTGHRFTGDEPLAEGGRNLGPAPFDLLTAALAECSAMTARWYARRKGWPLDKVEVKVTHQRKDAADMAETVGKPGRYHLFEKQVILYGDKLTADQRTELIAAVGKCPVHRALQSDIVIHTK